MMRVLGPRTSVAGLVRQAAASGARVVVVPAGETKAESLQWFAEVLHFPDWFGHNLDALADSLGDWASGASRNGTDGADAGRSCLLVWDGVAALAAADPGAYADLRSVLADVDGDHADLDITVVER